MKKHLLLFTILLIFLIPFCSFSQDTLDIFTNPSFEDTPRNGSYYNDLIQSKNNNIKGWFDCGILNFSNQTAPDIHAEDTNYWNVSHAPSEGLTYLSLIARENGSWESISQQLKQKLDSSHCYQFSIDLSKAAKYESGVAGNSKELFSFANPVVLYIFGGVGYCNKSEFIYKSPPIDHEEWKTYEVNFQPMYDFEYLIIQVHYEDERDSYNGHMLIDNITKCIVSQCNED